MVEVATGGKKSYRPSHVYDPYDEWSRREFRPLIEGVLLDEKTHARDLYNKKEIKKMLAQHMSGRKNHEEAIYLLFTFEMWLRLFLDNSKGF
jgi:asparagine synthase (glutamine-hydrolysing)